MKNNFVYIKHIIEATDKIETYIRGVDFAIFSSNSIIFDAVIRELEIIGEAAGKIDEEFQKQYPDIPWRKIIGARNILIHEYFGINKKIVWDTCQNDLKELKQQLTPFTIE